MHTGTFEVFFDLSWRPIDAFLPGDDLNLFVLVDDGAGSTADPLISAPGLIGGLLPVEIQAGLPSVEQTTFGGVTLAGNGFDLATSQETITLIDPPAGAGIFGVQLIQLGDVNPNNTGITLKVRSFLDGVVIDDPPAVLVQDLRAVGEVGPFDQTGALPVHPIDPP